MSNRNSFIESTKQTDERLEALKQLYPEIFSDGKINLDAFKDVTGTSDLPEGQDRKIQLIISILRVTILKFCEF